MKASDLQIYDLALFHHNHFGWGGLFQILGGSWSSHIAPILYNKRIGTGDSKFNGSKFNPIEKTLSEIDKGKIEVKIYRIKEHTKDELILANEWWLDNVQGTGYDFWAYIGLSMKVLFIDSWQIDTGKEKDWYCYEGTMGALKKATGKPLMDVEVFTPRAFEKFASRSKKLECLGMLES